MTALLSKLCTACDVAKPLEQFNKHPTNRFGRMHQCKRCHNGRRRGSEARRRTLGSVPSGYACPICARSKPQAAGKWWCADHDHETGQVRSWVCRVCNTALGGLKDSPAVLASALRYLHAHGKALTTDDLHSLLELHQQSPP